MPLATRILRSYTRANSFYWLLKTQIFYRTVFAHLGSHTRIIQPLKFECPEFVFIGESTTINRLTWLGAYPIVHDHPPALKIGNRCAIGNFNHITCVTSVEIADRVLTADRVHISDNFHTFERPNHAIIDQPVSTKGPVRIGFGTWIGENVSVLSASIGRNCVIGANSVVTKDIPDFSVAVGAPAVVIKRFNPKTNRWERTPIKVYV